MASAPESAPPLAVGGGQNGFLAAQMVLMKNEQELRKSEIAQKDKQLDMQEKNQTALLQQNQMLTAQIWNCGH